MWHIFQFWRLPRLSWVLNESGGNYLLGPDEHLVWKLGEKFAFIFDDDIYILFYLLFVLWTNFSQSINGNPLIRKNISSVVRTSQTKPNKQAQPPPPPSHPLPHTKDKYKPSHCGGFSVISVSRGFQYKYFAPRTYLDTCISSIPQYCIQENYKKIVSFSRNMPSFL